MSFEKATERLTGWLDWTRPVIVHVPNRDLAAWTVRCKASETRWAAGFAGPGERLTLWVLAVTAQLVADLGLALAAVGDRPKVGQNDKLSDSDRLREQRRAVVRVGGSLAELATLVPTDWFTAMVERIAERMPAQLLRGAFIHQPQQATMMIDLLCTQMLNAWLSALRCGDLGDRAEAARLIEERGLSDKHGLMVDDWLGELVAAEGFPKGEGGSAS